ncbi:hypothetical protein ASE48_06740 [Mycobacterium sp. Root265]|nr:hypothetical protein ASE48_06740 [Mycobacterium sp. Root265]
MRHKRCDWGRGQTHFGTELVRKDRRRVAIESENEVGDAVGIEISNELQECVALPSSGVPAHNYY